jgi:hypothetical protein
MTPMGLGIGLGLSEGGAESNPSGLLPGHGDMVIDDEAQWITLPQPRNDPTGLKFTGRNGGRAKFIFDLGSAASGAIYTMKYTADWSQLSNTGKEVFFGFGMLEADGDYHLVGNKGDGTTGIDIKRLFGTANFHSTSAPSTLTDVADNGTQSGPNWLQLEISVGGDTYTLRSSVDGDTWDDELTGITPSPATDCVTPVTFGVAIFLENTDKGAFDVIVNLWENTPFTLQTVASIKQAAFFQPDPTKITVPSIKQAAFFQPDPTKITVPSIKQAAFFTTPAVFPSLDGDFAPDSGTGTATHTYNSITAGPISAVARSVVAITWDNAGAVRTVSGVTFDGNTMTELHEAGRSTGKNVGCALYVIDGSQSGDIVVTFSGTVADSHITVLSPEDIISDTPVDVGDAGAATGTGTIMTNLLVPGMGGIRIAVYANDTGTTAVTWANAVEQVDVDAGNHRHSVAWVLNNADDDIDADGASDDHQLIGVALR